MRNAWWAARLLVSLSILVGIVFFVDIPIVVSQLVRVRPWPLCVALLIFGLTIMLHSMRWLVLLRKREIAISPLRIVGLVLRGNFLNLFLPGNLGGDVYRALGARRAAASLLQSAGIVLLERYCGLLATFLMALVAIIVTGYIQAQPLIAGLVLCLFILSLVPILFGAVPRVSEAFVTAFRALTWVRAADLIQRISMGVTGFARSPKLVLALIGLSGIMKACVAATFYLLSVSLAIDVSWVDLFVFLPIHTVVSAMPISLNGLGVREANVVGFFTQVGLSSDQAASLALLHLIWLYGTALPGGLLFFRREEESNDLRTVRNQ